MNINPYANGAASGAYEQGAKTASDYAGVTTQLAAITPLFAKEHGKNYINFALAGFGYLQNTGAISTAGSYGTDYKTTGLIPVKPYQNYVYSYVSAAGVVTTTQPVVVCLYDAAGTYISGSYVRVESGGYITFNSGSAIYAKVTYRASMEINTYKPQLEEGVIPTGYEAYAEGRYAPARSMFNAATIEDVHLGADLYAVRSAAGLTITGYIGNYQSVLTATFASGSNKVFSLTTLAANGITQSLGDDICPVRLASLGTVGANHGYALMFKCSINGQTTADTGSTWTDGTRTYVLVDVIAGYAYFLCPYTVTDGVVGVNGTYPATTLTHVAGSTHTGNISITGMTTGLSLPECVNNYSVEILCDGKHMPPSLSMYCNKLTVRERYAIMSYKDIQDYLSAHIGANYKSNSAIAGCLEFAIDYEFQAGCKCLVSHSIKAIEKVSLGECGFFQAVALSAASHTLYRYIAGVASKGGYDFKTPVDMTSYADSIIFQTADMVDDAKPANRYCDVLKNASAVAKLAFAGGYIPDRSHSSGTIRAADSAWLWELAATKKVYPVAVYNKALAIGDSLNVLCYRIYYIPQNSETLAAYIEVGKNVYVFVDYHAVYSGKMSLDGRYIGMAISVIDSSNFTLMNDCVDQYGVAFKVTDTYGYAVLKLT